MYGKNAKMYIYFKICNERCLPYTSSSKRHPPSWDAKASTSFSYIHGSRQVGYACVCPCVCWSEKARVSVWMPHDDINRSKPCRSASCSLLLTTACTAAIPVALTPVSWQTTGAERRGSPEVMLVHIGFSCKGSLALNDESRTGSFSWKGHGSQREALSVVFQETVTAVSSMTRGLRCPRLVASGSPRGLIVAIGFPQSSIPMLFV